MKLRFGCVQLGSLGEEQLGELRDKSRTDLVQPRAVGRFHLRHGRLQ